MIIFTKKIISKFSIKKRSMRSKSQYRKNQISVFDNYEKTEQNSKSNENEKYQFDQKKSAWLETKNRTKIKTNVNSLSASYSIISSESKNSFEFSKRKNSLNLKSKLTSSSHVKQKSFARKRASIFFSNKKNLFRFYQHFWYKLKKKNHLEKEKKLRISVETKLILIKNLNSRS